MKCICQICGKTSDIVSGGINFSNKKLTLDNRSKISISANGIIFDNKNFKGVCKNCYDTKENEYREIDKENREIKEKLKPKFESIDKFSKLIDNLKKEITKHKQKTARYKFQATKPIDVKLDEKFIL